MLAQKANDPDAGRAVFAAHCQSCHGITGPADVALGPDLRGIYGRRVGQQDSGVHSRALRDSTAVWDRDSLRHFLSNAPQAAPGTLMAARITDERELDALLDFLQTLQ
jgi:cytochrome c